MTHPPVHPHFFSPMLLVDDDEVHALRLAQAMATRQLDVCVAHDYTQAVQLARRLALRTALVDVRLPGLSGLEVVDALLHLHPHLRIVMLTGYGSITTAIDAMRRGAFDYLTKPVDADEILTCLAGQTKFARQKIATQATPSLARVEWEHIARVLADCDGNLTQAAKILGIHRRSLQRKLKNSPPAS